MAFNVLKIKALILQKGISQEKLASEINVTKQTIINYFNGRTRIDVDMIEKIAGFLNVPVNYFFDEEATPSNEVQEDAAEYHKPKKKYLEQRVEEIEDRLKRLEEKK